MQQINHPKPDIKIYRSGQIDIYTKASRRMHLDRDSTISFFIDKENNLYIKRVQEDGLHPTSVHGANYLRFYSADTVKRILSLPDIPEGIVHAGFRIGEPEDGDSFPIITRRVL